METFNNSSIVKEKKERLTWIDSLKGFAILTVVLGHVTSEYFNLGELADYKNIELIIRNCIYAFHMPLFIMISGFVFSIAYIKSDGLSKKNKVGIQLGNIGIIYFFWNSLSCIARIVFSSQVHNGASIKSILMFPLKAVDPFWYLYVLLFCYLLTMLLSKALTQKGVARYVIYIVSLACCLFHFYINKYLFGYTISKVFLYYLFFIVGVLFQRSEKALKIISNPFSVIAHFAVGAALVAIFVVGSDEAVTWSSVKYFGVIMAYALSVAFFGFAKLLSGFGKSGKKSFLAWLGKYSLEIYTIHCFITTVMRMVLHKLPFIGFWPNVLINFVMAVAVPIVASIVLKKMKLHGLLFAPATWVKSLSDKRKSKAQ